MRISAAVSGWVSARPDRKASGWVARTTLRAEFDDCKISTGPGTTTLRAELPDQGALCGLVRRIADLGLEVVDMHVVAQLGGD